jgi:Spy/CpxP family protein refolding chaperone
MKNFLPLLAAATMFVSTPVLAATPAVPSAEDVVVAQASPPPGGVSVDVAAPAHPRFTLSDSQLEQLRALKNKYFEANATKRAQLSILKNQLKTELTKENVDRSAAMNLQNQINALRGEMSNSRLAQMLDAQAIFTPEQRKQMHSRMLRGGFGHGYRGKRGGCHGGKGMHSMRGGFGGGFKGPRAEGATPGVQIKPVSQVES